MAAPVDGGMATATAWHQASVRGAHNAWRGKEKGPMSGVAGLGEGKGDGP